MSFYPPHVLPRVELKYQAKQLLRGNWPVIIGVTLLFLLLSGLMMNVTYIEETPELTSAENAGALDYLGVYFGYSLSVLGSAVSGLGAGQMILFVVLAVASALLVDGVLNYCYNAWFWRLVELGGSRPLSFNDFVETFSSGLTALLAYVWQQLWLNIWSLIGLPGFLLMATGGLMVMTGGDSGSGAMGFAMFVGSLIYIAANVVVIFILIRYSFIFQLIADGRGKVGPRQALRYSCAITKGHLRELLVLNISFIPWILFGAFTLGIGLFYVYPYMTTTMALSYRWLRDEAFADGRLDPAALGYVARGAQQADNGPVIDV